MKLNETKCYGMKYDQISVKWWLFAETFAVDFFEDPKKLRPAALFPFFHICTISQILSD